MTLLEQWTMRLPLLLKWLSRQQQPFLVNKGWKFENSLTYNCNITIFEEFKGASCPSYLKFSQFWRLFLFTLRSDRPCFCKQKYKMAGKLEVGSAEFPISVQFLRSSCLLNFTVSSGKKTSWKKSCKTGFSPKSDWPSQSYQSLSYSSVLKANWVKSKRAMSCWKIGCKFPFPFCQLFGNSENLEISSLSQRTF